MTVLLREITREELYRSSVQNIKSAPEGWLTILRVLRSSLWQDVLTLRLLCRMARNFLLNLKVVIIYRLKDF